MTTQTPTQTDAAGFRLFLQNELLQRCDKNPAYSLRAFARALQCDVATLSKILKGQRGVGKITIQKLGLRLGLTPSQIQRFLNPAQAGRPVAAQVIDYQQLSLDSFQVISDWYHYGILELMRVDHFRPDRRWIARTLGITATEVNIAVERLERLGMLKIEANGEWTDLTGGTSTTTGNAFTAEAFRRMQKQVLELAIRALEEVPMERRDQSSMTMAIDADRLAEAKARIKAFRRELAQFLSRGEKRNDLYQLSLSLFPLTRTNAKEVRK